jgi:WD40 repeat protein
MFSQDIRDVYLSQRGNVLLVCDTSGAARIWDVAAARAVTPTIRHAGHLAWATLHDHGQQIVTVGETGVVSFWRLPRAPEEDKAPAERPGNDRGLREIQLVNGPTVATRQTTEGVLRPPAKSGVPADGAVFSPDGSLVVVCDDARKVRVWDTATRAPLTELQHQAAVVYAAFSPDGRRLLTATDEGTVRLWDAVTGEVLAPHLRHRGDVIRVFFRAGGGQACAVHRDGVMTAWDVTPDDRPIDDLLAAVRELTQPPGVRAP